MSDEEVDWDLQWKQIPGFPDYWMSEDKRIINMRTHHMYKPRKKLEIPVVRIHHNGRVYERRVNTLHKELFG